MLVPAVIVITILSIVFGIFYLQERRRDQEALCGVASPETAMLLLLWLHSRKITQAEPGTTSKMEPGTTTGTQPEPASKLTEGQLELLDALVDGRLVLTLDGRQMPQKQLAKLMSRRNEDVGAELKVRREAKRAAERDAELAAIAEQRAKEISAPKEYDPQPKGIQEPLPQTVLRTKAA